MNMFDFYTLAEAKQDAFEDEWVRRDDVPDLKFIKDLAEEMVACVRSGQPSRLLWTLQELCAELGLEVPNDEILPAPFHNISLKD